MHRATVRPEGDATKNFSFDASAAAAANLKQQVLSGKTRPASGPRYRGSFVRTPLEAQPEAKHCFADPETSIDDLQSERTSDPSLGVPEFRVAIRKDEPVRSGRRFWLASLTIYGLILLLLSFLTLTTLQTNEVFDFVASPITYEDETSLQNLEIDAAEDLDALETDLASQLPDPQEAALGDLSSESVLADLTGDLNVPHDGLGDLGALFGDSGNGLAELGEGIGSAGTASFFGTKVEGNRILYILDNSGGMQSGKLETLIDELLDSVGSLRPKQQFYVIFYSDTVYPLFYPRSATNFVNATNENKQLLRDWLETIELCLGNSIDEALAAAAVIRPDTVFLLSDGRLFTTASKQRMLLDGPSRAFPINTFGMGVKANSTPAKELQLVAEANRGTYRAVEVSEDAKTAAQARPRLYHNEGPGMVWGRAVTAR